MDDGNGDEDDVEAEQALTKKPAEDTEETEEKPQKPTMVSLAT